VTVWAAAAFVCLVFLTSAFSGVFGMAGGLVLLWVLLMLLPTATAIAVQGIIQLTSNGARAWISREFIDWKISAIAATGLIVSAIVFLAVSYSPDLAVVSISIGLMPLLVWIPKSWFVFDASRPAHAFWCGIVAGSLNVGIGTSGPSIDIFFVRTMMDRRGVIATKAFLQASSHVIKILFYLHTSRTLFASEWLLVLAAAPFAIGGTSAGAAILRRLTDESFRKWTRVIVTVVGGAYLARGVSLLW